jgi:GxxExxY protein
MREQLEEAAEAVFAELGPGWSESVYHKAMIRELSERGIPHYTEGSIAVMYKGWSVGTRRPDISVQTDEPGSVIIVELKAGSNRGQSQLKQYLKMGEASVDLGTISGGMLIQFNDKLECEYFERD